MSENSEKISIYGGLTEKIIVHNHGYVEDQLVLRVNGIKSDLELIIKAVEKVGMSFKELPIITESYPRSQFTVLLKIIIPET